MKTKNNGATHCALTVFIPLLGAKISSYLPVLNHTICVFLEGYRPISSAFVENNNQNYSWLHLKKYNLNSMAASISYFYSVLIFVVNINYYRFVSRWTNLKFTQFLVLATRLVAVSSQWQGPSILRPHCMTVIKLPNGILREKMKVQMAEIVRNALLANFHSLCGPNIYLWAIKSCRCLFCIFLLLKQK
jgi:hypothetical protein